MAATFSDLVDGANRDIKFPIKMFGAAEGETPRFEAYHANFSVCSNKVRSVLLEKEIPFASHVLKLVASEDHTPECYRPGYVRMRLKGAPGAEMVGEFSGRSSVSSQGFDPCVVPTLADHANEKIVVDSANICAYLDREAGSGPRLIPDDLAEAINAQISLIDEAPHVAVLYGPNPHGDDRPDSIAPGLVGVHDRKITHLQVLKSAADTPELRAAYEAKINKEESAKNFIYDRDVMLDAHAQMAQHVADLEAQLSTHDGEWAMGDAYTMADIMWSVSMFRLKWLGLGHHWEKSDAAPRVARYVKSAFARPAFKEAVIDWPRGTPPSPHLQAA